MSAKGRPLAAVTAVLIAGGALVWISAGNLGENLVYYWSPTELNGAGDKAAGATVRLGGLVQPGSVDWDPDSQRLSFRISDGTEEVRVVSNGSPPQMFREGIGVVVEGQLQGADVFHTDRVMVKHSNEYRAPDDAQMPSVEEMYRTIVAEGPS